MVWGTALGLQSRIEDVLQRSLEDVKQDGTNASAIWFPAWYQSSSGAGFANAAGATGSGGSLFSGSGIPDIGGMMGALGTIGNSPASSGSSGRWRLLGRWLGRWRGRRRRRLLGGGRQLDRGRLGLDGLGAEQVEAAVEPLDRDRRPRPRAPHLRGHAEVLDRARDPARARTR